tara:strand:- start:152 stop:283 length:132 start_codon:yes stop_codon:yes gene_type:complete
MFHPQHQTPRVPKGLYRIEMEKKYTKNKTKVSFTVKDNGKTKM